MPGLFLASVPGQNPLELWDLAQEQRIKAGSPVEKMVPPEKLSKAMMRFQETLENSPTEHVDLRLCAQT